LPFGDVPMHPTCADCSISDRVSSCQLRTTPRYALQGRTYALLVGVVVAVEVTNSARMLSSPQALAAVNLFLLSYRFRWPLQILFAYGEPSRLRVRIFYLFGFMQRWPIDVYSASVVEIWDRRDGPQFLGSKIR
jgi:hypothetical protein